MLNHRPQQIQVRQTVQRFVVLSDSVHKPAKIGGVTIHVRTKQMENHVHQTPNVRLALAVEIFVVVLREGPPGVPNVISMVNVTRVVLVITSPAMNVNHAVVARRHLQSRQDLQHV